MRIFNSPVKNYLYLGYRLVSPVIDPVRFVIGIWGYVWFIRDFFVYGRKNPQEKLFGLNIFPILHEKVSFTPFDSHYFFQELWAFKHIVNNVPKKHVDVASKYQFSGFVSTITKTEFVDIRPIQTTLENLSIVNGSILSLPYKNNSVESISTLHVIEHIGLGRYGDPIDPEGTKKACMELTRVLKKGGRLYVSVPTGLYRVCFNAHRVHPPETLISYFPRLKLLEFSVVTDTGKYYEDVNYKQFSNMKYGCGMYLFTKE